MPATVLLIRHPESAWNRVGIYQGRQDAPLSPLGHKQVVLIAERLDRERLAGVVSSPLQRARSLAQAIACRHGLDASVDERLTEIAHGSWEGLARQEVERRFPDLYRLWLDQPSDVHFPGGESLLDVHRRSVEWIGEALARTGVWAVVTHDTVARLVIAAARGRAIAGFSEVTLENGAISRLVGPTLVGSLRELNDTSHLRDHRADLKGQAL